MVAGPRPFCRRSLAVLLPVFGRSVAGPRPFCRRSLTFPSQVPDRSVAGPQIPGGPGTAFVVLCALPSLAPDKNADRGHYSPGPATMEGVGGRKALPVGRKTATCDVGGLRPATLWDWTRDAKVKVVAGPRPFCRRSSAVLSPVPDLSVAGPQIPGGLITFNTGFWTWSAVSPMGRRHWGTKKGTHMRPFLKVPRAGIEPARYCYHRILSPARLPIPPSGLMGLQKYGKIY